MPPLAAEGLIRSVVKVHQTLQVRSSVIQSQEKRGTARGTGLEARSVSMAGTTPASCRSTFLPPTCFAFAQVRC